MIRCKHITKQKYISIYNKKKKKKKKRKEKKKEKKRKNKKKRYEKKEKKGCVSRRSDTFARQHGANTGSENADGSGRVVQQQ